jgi:hypothetical protein
MEELGIVCDSAILGKRSGVLCLSWCCAAFSGGEIWKQVTSVVVGWVTMQHHLYQQDNQVNA